MITLQMLPAAALWTVVIIRLVGLRFGWKPGILPGMAAVAVGATLNIDQIYVFVDSLLGERNLLNLIVHLFMGAGMTELSRLLLKATGRSDDDGGRHMKALIGMGIVMAVIQTALLLVSDTPGSATNFTDAFASIPTIAPYQASFFAWIGVVLGYTGVACLRRDKSGESREFGRGLGVVSAGCGAGVGAVLMKMLLIGLEYSGVEASFALYIGYRVLIALTLLCFAAGFAVPSSARMKTAAAARRRRAGDLDALRPIVRRLATTDEGKRAMDAANVSLNARTSKTQLYRWFILIGDIRVLRPGLLSPEEVHVIDEIGTRIEDNGTPARREVIAGG
ncbi:hypothetical protein N2K95_03480 [Arthrobacter zhaoxinii]|uniref:Uncharacterized protein n=1 Tax=Arthrobacter zhaoxinii TaxID=2964616 RepID=A0ABY5YS54_9MICC|nr:hypothetical protein [Arthrobacter zhaoxinii]UWX97758.1 hypothetical protein N2K95_03480 [Arthrobacter zhaoxinii]